MTDPSATVLTCIGRILGIPADALDADTDLHALGLDSLARVSIISDLEQVLQTQFSADQMLALFESATVRDLVIVIAAVPLADVTARRVSHG